MPIPGSGGVSPRYSARVRPAFLLDCRLQNFQQRKRLLEHDDVMNQQREVVYSLRLFALERGEELKAEARRMIAGGGTIPAPAARGRSTGSAMGQGASRKSLNDDLSSAVSNTESQRPRRTARG
jgi:SecA-like APTase subunit of protein translocation complex